MTIAAFLLIAYMLSWFGLDEMIIKAFDELFSKTISSATYYFIFFCLGIIGDLYLIFTGNYIWLLNQ